MHTSSQMPFVSLSCFTERDDNQDVSLKTIHWRKAKSHFLPTAEFKNMTALMDWACLLIPKSRRVGSHSYCHNCFSPMSKSLSLNMLLGTSSEQHGLLRKRRIISVLAPLSGIRTSSAITIANSAPAAKALLKFRADLQTSCFEMKSATLLSFSFVSWYAFSFLTATDC